MITALFSTHTCIHTVLPVFFFALSPFSLPFLSYSASPAACVNGTPLCFVVGPLQAQLCLTRALRLSIDIDRAALCVSESPPLTVSLFFHLLTAHVPIGESSSFSHPLSTPSHSHFPCHSPSFLYFDLFLAVLPPWWVSVSVGRLHMERSIQPIL